MTGTFSTAELLAALARSVEKPEIGRYCVAFSGGVDSTAVLYGLSLLRSDYPGMGLRAVHANHHLMEEAGAWAEHCRAIAEKLQVSLRIVDLEVEKGAGVSVEAAAREARYGALEGILEDGEMLVTGHHQNDQLETMLLQLFRGAGVAGLAAMPPAMSFGRGVHLRPLLEVSRDALEEFVSAAGLESIEDGSNADERFDRNYLRHRVLPAIRERWPAAPASAVRSAAHLAEAQRLLDELGRTDLQAAQGGDAVSVGVDALRALDAARARNLLRYWIRDAGFRLPSTVKLRDILRQMFESREDAKPSIQWENARIRRQRGRIYLERVSD